MKHSFFSANRLTCYPYALLFLGSIVVLLPSSLAPFANKLTGTMADPTVYIYCADQILHGKIMYKELFDHKGPVLYLINVIGLLIGGGNSTGIWFVELMSLFGASIFIFKSVCLYFDRWIALLATLSCLLLVFPLLGGGNFSEEYAFPLISISMYFFLYFFKYQNVYKSHFAIMALCLACAFLIKPNFIALWVAGYLFVLIILLKNNRLKELMPIVLISIVSFVVVCLPFALYFTCTDSWAEFKFCFWDFNRTYSDISFSTILLRTCRRFWFPGHLMLSMIGRMHVITFFFVGLIYFKQLIYRIESFFIFFTIILTNTMISIGSYEFLNYYILFVPLFALPYATILCLFVKKLAVNPKLIICLLFLLLCSGSVIFIKDAYKNVDSTEKFISFIKENSANSDKITVLGNACWVYLYADRESVSKYSYQSPHSVAKQYGAIIAESYLNDIKNGKPRIIITDKSLGEDWEIYLSGLYDLLNTQYEKALIADNRFDCWLKKQ